MPEIILTTLNARYAHASFGLRYLFANLGPLKSRAIIREFDIAWRPVDVIESLLRENPKIIGLGVYIWNVQPATQLVAELKSIRPDITLILGGPQVSYETHLQEICRLADYVITGEADLEFPKVCHEILSGRPPIQRVIESPPPDLSRVSLPYDLYDDKDIDHRVVYVEASRGCPFSCEFCLSSLEIPVRNFPLENFLSAMQSLLDRGLRRFKFVDRTFNLNLQISRAILQFFLERMMPDFFLHFEMIPDRLPDGLRELIAKFPAGILQFEVGIQSFDEAVCGRISRRQDVAKLENNLKFLRRDTGVHVHADLIAGLPGEDLPTFAAGFDRLVALGPQEIQVGLLKRLPGTPIVRHDAEWAMRYSPHAPFEILQTRSIDFPTMQRLRRFSRYWDLVGNSGNFVQTTPLIWGENSPFDSFLRWSDWLFAQTAATHGISLSQLTELLWRYLTEEAGVDPATAAQAIWNDYRRCGRSDRPAYLRPWIGDEPVGRATAVGNRQARHRGLG